MTTALRHFFPKAQFDNDREAVFIENDVLKFNINERLAKTIKQNCFYRLLNADWNIYLSRRGTHGCTLEKWFDWWWKGDGWVSGVT